MQKIIIVKIFFRLGKKFSYWWQYGFHCLKKMSYFFMVHIIINLNKKIFTFVNNEVSLSGGKIFRQRDFWRSFVNNEFFPLLVATSPDGRHIAYVVQEVD